MEHDPVLHALLTASVAPEEDAGTAEARREYQQGQARPWVDVRKELPGG